ncbi:MAG TPA: ScpA family protein [Chloroflexia bacterium]|nr:ScpA family protein [Chloroflexia bacterium]
MNEAESAPAGYAVRLPDFEGPLDVLLRLIERQELAISQVSLALVADQFLAYVEALPAPEPGVLASFMVVAAKLLLIKSQALLPRPPPAPVAADDEEDVGAELVRRLEEYRAIQQTARELRARDAEGLHSYPRPAAVAGRRRPVQRPPTLGLEGVSLGQLTALVSRRLQLALPLDEPPAILPHEITLDEKVAELDTHLAAAGPGGAVAVWPLLVAARSRAEVVVTFMAVLELLRRHRVSAEQAGEFGEIWLRVLPPAPGEPPHP